jgi:hypothetical protein
MNRTKGAAILSLVLSGLVLAALVLSHLALTDVYHGIEPDLETEWWIVRITFLLVIVLVLTAVYSALLVLRAGETNS